MMNIVHKVDAEQGGFSLVELMIAMTVGLLILGGTIRVFQNQRINYQLQQGLEQVQESGRFLEDFIGADLRMAGYPRNSDALTTAITGTEGGSANSSDRVTIQYESTINCGGDATGGAITQNQYLIQNNAGGLPELGCIGTIATGTQYYPLVENCERMQILYGEDTDTLEDGQVNVYRKASNVVDWSRVLTVRIAWLVSNGQNVGGSEIRAHRLLNEAPVGPFTDGWLRRIFSTTIVLRNRTPY
ncbi:MAG: PilW family protein [Magnetococcales bacterium]|nr:PilW family protein [Magnetococcales bacterium]